MRGIHTCSPEPVSTINITQSIVQMDSDTAFFVDERFTGANVVNGILTLSYTPHAAASVHLYLNTGAQLPVSNYVVVGNTIRFTFTPAVDDKIHVKYFSTQSGVVAPDADTGLPSGFTMGFSGVTSVPDGWLLMSAETSVTAAAFADLFAFLTSNPHLINETPGEGVTTYTLKAIQTPYYIDGQIMAGNTIIKI